MDNNNTLYAKDEMAGKFICCFRTIHDENHVWDCVRYFAGPNAGRPYLYSKKLLAYNDENYDPDWDEVIPAEDFFKHIKDQEENDN